MDTEEPSNKKNRTEKNEIQITGKETEEEFLEKVLRLEDEVMAEAETENGNNTYQNQPIRKEIQDEIKKEPVEEEEKETESDPDDPEKIVDELVEDLDMLTEVKQEKESVSMDAYVEPNSPDSEGGLAIDTEVPPSRPPSRQESTESTRQESTENSPQILPPHLKNEIRKVFVAQIKEGTDKRVRMTFKTIEKEVPTLQVRNDLMTETNGNQANEIQIKKEAGPNMPVITQVFANIPSLNTPTISTAVSGQAQELTSTQTAGTPKSLWTYPQLIPTEPRAVDQPFPPAVKGSYNYPCITKTRTIENPPETLSAPSTISDKTLAAMSNLLGPYKVINRNPTVITLEPDPLVEPQTTPSASATNTTATAPNNNPPVNHQELIRRKRLEKKMACEVLDKECRRIECLKKGIFAHSSEKPDNHRRYLKQANFLFTRVLTRRMRENGWQCQWCPRAPEMTKKQALMHVRTQHGMLLKKTDNAKEMVQWIQGVGIRSLARIKSTGPTINYPCHATSVSDPDPDPYWIRIQSDHWIRIRIRNLNTDPDPDPGGQK
jgi:hypothetical protein